MIIFVHVPKSYVQQQSFDTFCKEWLIDNHIMK